MKEHEPHLFGGFGEIDFGKQYRQGNRVYSSFHVATALTANPVGNLGGYTPLYLVRRFMLYKGYVFRIRKLTPCECWRLMAMAKRTYGVWDDTLFNKAFAENSNTQLYKQAGNGIVAAVIEAIGKQMVGEVSELNLVELFGGIGCQRKGLQDAGIRVISKGYCDFDRYAVKSYNAMWDENYEPTDITQLHSEDLYTGIGDVPTMWTYSFPCTDLSVAGAGKGMAKGSGTRSGLLWEVERLLLEKIENGEPLPDYLLMENVIQVHGKKNLEPWNQWCEFLESIGYYSTWCDLNARDFGIAQNRNRTFMLSSLTPLDWFKWPEPVELTTCMADYLDEVVDEKYYINSEKSDDLIRKLIESGELDAYVGEEDACV